MGEGAESNQRDNSSFDLDGRIRERDSITPSPEERAGFILNLIKDKNNSLTNWDILCFCVEYLGSQVLVYDWLGLEEIKSITARVQLAHYMRDDIPETGVT